MLLCALRLEVCVIADLSIGYHCPIEPIALHKAWGLVCSGASNRRARDLFGLSYYLNSTLDGCGQCRSTFSCNLLPPLSTVVQAAAQHIQAHRRTHAAIMLHVPRLRANIEGTMAGAALPLINVFVSTSVDCISRRKFCYKVQLQLLLFKQE